MRTLMTGAQRLPSFQIQGVVRWGTGTGSSGWSGKIYDRVV